MNPKRIVAREWLILVSMLLIGFLIVFIFAYIKAHDREEQRLKVYSKLSNEFHLKLGTFEEFSVRLDSSHVIRMFYDKLSEKYEMPQYSVFVDMITRTRLSNAWHSIIDKNNLALSVMLILSPYLVFQFARSLRWSLRTLEKN